MKKNIVIQILLILFFATLGFFLRYLTLDMGFGDSERYLEMAKVPGKFIGSPWGYRIALPYLAAGLADILKIPLTTVFLAVQLVMFGTISTLIIKWVSNTLERGVLIGILGAIIFVLSYPGVYNLHNFVHVGLGEHLLILLGCIAIYKDKFIFLSFIIAISCFVKESVGFLLIPTYFVSSALLVNWRTASIHTALLLLAFLVPFFFLRSGAVIFQSDLNLNTYTSFYTLEYVRYCWEYWGGFIGALRSIVFWFGTIFLLSTVGFFIAPVRLKTLAVLPVLAILQIVLATDIQRMVGVSIPVLIALSSFTLSKMKNSHAILASILLGFHFLYLNHRIGGIISFVVSFCWILVLLWGNRSSLFIPIIKEGKVTGKFQHNSDQFD